ncbi:hypothetical protein HNR60_004664 [Rhodopseudomonas rhenobacensis]|uniref:Porin n=1 Tax=Rhodopseudomonas rhenobacensis TaxID=87461 RepID=A0A7W8E1H5_9BRAD|nr:porin [Rhodopseudomonas rhenobacensis]MBB5049880.1 hypothetical protein [Rhodopseudomonas rhenobacensis]
MNFVKGLMLGTAATFVATAGAQAADLPLKAKAVEYVKVCSLYGAGFYYIPGTDTCIKLGGYLRAEVGFNTSGATETPAWNGNAGQQNRLQNQAQYRARQDITIDTRTATEYGVVRTYFDSVFTWTTGGTNSTVAGGELGVYFAFVQFAGFTFGKAVSQFSTPWNGSPGNIGSNLLGGDDTSTGVNQIAYTAQFGNGISASVSLEDPYGYRQAQGVQNVFNTDGGGSASTWLSGTGPGTGVNYVAGTQIPDIVGQLRVDQAWGLFQVSAAAHQIRASYYTAAENSGHPGDKWGYAVLAALSLKNLPTGPGDTINLDGTYANGATRYVISGTGSINNMAMFGGTSAAGAYESVGLGTSVDGVFGTNGDIQKTTAWGVRGAFNHNWNPNWSTSLFGAYTSIDFGGAGGDLYTIGLRRAVGGTFTGTPNFNIAQIGTVTRWTPVKNLTFSGEVMYTQLDQNYSGTTGVTTAVGTNPAGVRYEFKDQDTWTGAVRVQRNF